MNIGARGPRLAGQNQALLEIVGVQHVARNHVDLARDHGRHARAAAALPARVGHGDARLEQCLDQRLPVGPAQMMASTVQLDVDARDLRHPPIVSDPDGRANPAARWPGRCAPASGDREGERCAIPQALP